MKRSLPVRAQLSDKIQGVAKLVSAILVIGGFVVSVCTWGINQVMDTVDERVSAVEHTVEEIHRDTVRTQLLLLIHNTPEDHESIINVAWQYFRGLDGDWYMTTIFQDWANSQELDVSNLLKGVK